MKKFLSVVAVGVLSLTGLFADDTMTLNLPLNSKAGVTDSSQYKNVAELSENAYLGEDALELDGEKSYVIIEDSKNIAMKTGSLTTVISFKAAKNITGSVALISSGALSNKGDAGYSFIYDSKSKRFLFYISDGSQRLCFSSSTNDLLDDNWHTAAFSYDKKAQKVTIALDGRILTENIAGRMTPDMNDGAKKVRIGAWNWGYFFIGSIKNVKMYKVAHSSTQLVADTKQ